MLALDFQSCVIGFFFFNCNLPLNGCHVVLQLFTDYLRADWIL